MMSFASDISVVFPKTIWTGMSNIHVSLFAEGVLHIPFSQRPAILYSLMEKNVGVAIYKKLMHHFGKMEWLLEESIFAKLFLVDIDLMLQGKKTSESPNRIKNPATGNLFHRVALLPPYVGGVRFWAEKSGPSTLIGFRFRLVKLSGDEEIDVRAEAREREAAVIVEVASVYDAIAEVKEPPVKAIESASNLICSFA